MKTIDSFFAPNMEEEHRPIIMYRDAAQDMIVDCARLLTDLPAEQRDTMVKTIETLADTYRFLDDMHTTYMTGHAN